MSASVSQSAYADAAHLLRRTGFGGTTDEITATAQKGIAAATAEIINYELIPDTIDDDAFLEQVVQAMPERLRGNAPEVPLQAIKVWWTYRMLASPRPFQEKMCLFWHNHFTSTDRDGALMIRQNQLYRRHALGNFRNLVMDVSRDAEMLHYLNGNQNYKAHPNENYARELMELFTCGRVGPDGKPNYTENDVKAAARAFSGWNLGQEDFEFHPVQHDDAPKTFMGKTGNFNGNDIVDMLVALPLTAHYICRKLFRYLAYYDPEPAVMDTLVKTYYDTGYDIKAIVTQILSSNAFWSPKARFGLFKSPVEYVIGTVKMAGLSQLFIPTAADISGDTDEAITMKPVRGRRGDNPFARLTGLVLAMRQMGQDVLSPPTVKGWDGGTMWINTNSIQARGKFAALLGAVQPLPGALLGTNATTPEPPADPAAVVDTVTYRMGPLHLSDTAYQALLAYAKTEVPFMRVRGVFSLVLGTAEYQMN